MLTTSSKTVKAEKVGASHNVNSWSLECPPVQSLYFYVYHCSLFYPPFHIRVSCTTNSSILFHHITIIMKLKVVSRGVVSVSLPLPNPGPDNTNVTNNDTNNIRCDEEFIKKEAPDNEQGLVLALFTPDLDKSLPSSSTTPPCQVSWFPCLYLSVCVF